jgi:hypothetical protein
MRLLSILLVTIFIGTACSSQKKADMTTTQIEYTAVSRGVFIKIVAQNKSVLVSNDRNAPAITHKIDDAKWNQIVSAFSAINLESIPSLKAPSEKRFYDGAAIGNLTIIQNQKTYQTKGFDHGFPPKKIEKLVKLLLDFAKD